VNLKYDEEEVLKRCYENFFNHGALYRYCVLVPLHIYKNVMLLFNCISLWMNSV